MNSILPENLPYDVPIDELTELLDGLRMVTLTGAGCSTESGIPDYRGPLTQHRKRNPIQYQEFANEAHTRQRYWARSTVGWPIITQATPNDGHHALARLERSGLVNGLITQNVDGLHTQAGNQNVIELHGSLGRVICLDCRHSSERRAFQELLVRANPGWLDQVPVSAPDGDAVVRDYDEFVVPECPECGGRIKPDVVFFGENVPKPVVQSAWELFDAADALLVIGSSLTVYSGYRFVRRAAELRKPVAIVNLGETRGDAQAWVKVSGRVGDVMPRLAQRLVAPNEG